MTAPSTTPAAITSQTVAKATVTPGCILLQSNGCSLVITSQSGPLQAYSDLLGPYALRRNLSLNFNEPCTPRICLFHTLEIPFYEGTFHFASIIPSYYERFLNVITITVRAIISSNIDFTPQTLYYIILKISLIMFKLFFFSKKKSEIILIRPRLFC